MEQTTLWYNISNVQCQYTAQGGVYNLLQFFGITCGLSAPYVAGQIDYTLHQVSHVLSVQWNSMNYESSVV